MWQLYLLKGRQFLLVEVCRKLENLERTRTFCRKTDNSCQLRSEFKADNLSVDRVVITELLIPLSLWGMPYFEILTSIFWHEQQPYPKGFKNHIIIFVWHFIVKYFRGKFFLWNELINTHFINTFIHCNNYKGWSWLLM